MCIACEMGFWGMVDALPPQEREKFLREQAEQFACEPAEPAAAPDVTPPTQDERKP